MRGFGGRLRWFGDGGTRWGGAGLAVIGAAVIAMALVCVQGPSYAVPKTGGWRWLDLRPSALTTLLLCWAVMAFGAVGVSMALRGLRLGWRPSPTRLMVAGLAVTAVLAVLPVAGSTDLLSYALYGREAVLGLDPAAAVPQQLIDMHDPVARFAPRAWRKTPSVYGPLANGLFWLAALLGGASMAAITLLLKLVMAAAFAGTALVLDRITAADPGRRRRVHLLWTLNPLMLWAGVVSAHVDGLAAFLMAAGLLAFHLRDRAPVPLLLLTGALLGAAAAVKAPFALAGLALAWTQRRSLVALAALALGAVASVVPAYLLAGQATVRVMFTKLDGISPVSPWRWPVKWAADASWTVTHETLGWTATALLLVLLAWRAPKAHEDFPEIRPLFVLCAAWLLASPLQRPWYDAMLFPLLALLPASRLDALLLFRNAVAESGQIPGVVPYRHWPLKNFGVYTYWYVSGAMLAFLAAIPATLTLPTRRTKTRDSKVS
ncbi:hypothetical protein ACSNOI_29025 [Actinomadura kijaniata]|uniref:hypothetical protein n=1 Tax=Actinomadura kijaniata TaxID=46161 RepID=UPI003F1DE04A